MICLVALAVFAVIAFGGEIFFLQSEDVEERLSVTELLGQMFSEQDSELATQNKALWNSYLGR